MAREDDNQDIPNNSENSETPESEEGAEEESSENIEELSRISKHIQDKPVPEQTERSGPGKPTMAPGQPQPKKSFLRDWRFITIIVLVILAAIGILAFGPGKNLFTGTSDTGVNFGAGKETAQGGEAAPDTEETTSTTTTTSSTTTTTILATTTTTSSTTTTTIPRCFDSDNGTNSEIKGYVTFRVGEKVLTVHDLCVGEQVNEHYCYQELHIDGLMNCVSGKGCYDGACIDESAIPTTTTTTTIPGNETNSTTSTTTTTSSTTTTTA